MRFLKMLGRRLTVGALLIGQIAGPAAFAAWEQQPQNQNGLPQTSYAFDGKPQTKAVATPPYLENSQKHEAEKTEEPEEESKEVREPATESP